MDSVDALAHIEVQGGEIVVDPPTTLEIAFQMGGFPWKPQPVVTILRSLEKGGFVELTRTTVTLPGRRMPGVTGVRITDRGLERLRVVRLREEARKRARAARVAAP